MYLERE